MIHLHEQSWPKKCVLGCVIPPAGAVARSRNIGKTFLSNSCTKKEFPFEACGMAVDGRTMSEVLSRPLLILK